MSLTKRYTAAMKRLAEHLGYTVESTGKLWLMTTPEGKPYHAPQKSSRCLGSLISVATSPLKWQGGGMSYAEVATVCKLRVPSRRIAPTRWWMIEIIKMQKAQEESE